MTTNDKIARRKLSLLDLASELSNVSRAARLQAIASASNRFSLRASDTSMPPNLAFRLKNRGTADPMPATDFCGRHSAFLLAQNPDDLLFREP